jgi:hypothetical protein
MTAIGVSIMRGADEDHVPPHCLQFNNTKRQQPVTEAEKDFSISEKKYTQKGSTVKQKV